MGRKAIEPSEKKTLIRVFVKQKIKDGFTPEELERYVKQFIKKLENETYN
jgi:hypothetical protein